jgi:UDP-N-acetylglucosamine/UDP-N-acetyl-alpha-D-glucosaminouronate 4-epimerase
LNALVTGGAGFIGHHIVRALLDREDGVSVIDDFSTGFRYRLDPFAATINLVDGSILDRAALDAAMADCDVVFHEAAIPSVARSMIAPLASNEANVTGTINVMLAAAQNGVRRVIFAGSSSVYGIPLELPCHELMRPMPESPYGTSKLAAEHYLRTLGKQLGIETVVLRYFNVFGPGQDPTSEYSAVVPKFIDAVLHDRRPMINGNGDISRDFTYVDNVVKANLLAASAPIEGHLTCNIACGGRTTLLELLDAICAAAGRTIEPIFGPPRLGDIVHSLADISLAQSALGYSDLVPFAEGISRTVAWYRDGPGN